MTEGLSSDSSAEAIAEVNAVRHNATSGQSLPQSGSAGGLSGHGMPSAISIGAGAAVAGTVTDDPSGPSRSPRTARNASNRPMDGSEVIMESLA